MNSDKQIAASATDSTTAPQGVVSLLRLESGIALITLGSPEERVVTLTVARMQSLKQTLQELKANPPKGLIITGSSPDMFTAGADINLIRDVTDAAQAESFAREGQSVFAMIEALPCPTLAAISGPCVGGGCELSLACRYRVITDHKSSIIGLPEVKLGILPGFGGTQRLPRIVGLPKALDIILGGKTLRPKQAYACGLVHEIVPVARLRDRCEEIVLGTKATRTPRLPLKDKILTYNNFARSFVKRNASAAIAKEARGHYPAPPAALQATLVGLEQGTEVGYKHEAKELGRLVVTPESKSLIRIFFLTEASKALGKSGRKAADHAHAVVIGAGVMGAGIAGVLARNDCQVILKDTSDEAINRGANQIKHYISKMSYLSEQERSFIFNRVETTTKESANLGNVTVAIEAIFEELATKKKVLGELARFLPADAIIASNTSSLSISDIATGIDNPERVIGMHFFNPVEKMPLVEIVRGKQTGARAIVTIAALATKIGKYPIVVEDVPGFLVNRILAPYIAEAGILLEEGFSVRDIDLAATEFGMPMGPVRLLDEVGLDVAAHVAEIMTKAYGDRMKAPAYPQKLVAAGRKGKKTGAGFYDFMAKEAVPHGELRALLGITKPEIARSNRQEITDRLILRLVNEAVLCFDEGVAGTPGTDAANQIDLGTVMGIGFPPFRGGVLHYAQTVGAKTLLEKLKSLESRHGLRFSPSPGIAKRADKNLSFFEAVKR